MIIYVKNYKGGVGKSTITKNLAHGMSLVGKKTMVVIFDTQNDSYKMLKGGRWEEKKGLKKFIMTEEHNYSKLRDNLHCYPIENSVFSNNSKKKILSAFDTLKKEYDIVIIDGAPAGDNLLDKVGIEVSDKIIVPMVMDTFSFDGLIEFLKSKDSKNVSMVIPNLFTGSKVNNIFHKDLKESLDGTRIKISRPIKKNGFEEELSHKGKTIFETNSKKILDIREVYIEIMEDILNG